MDNYTVAIKQDSPIWPLYQKLKADGVKDAELDTGYPETNYVRKTRKIVHKGDRVIQGPEAVNAALEKYERFQLDLGKGRPYNTPVSIAPKVPASSSDSRLEETRAEALAMHLSNLGSGHTNSGKLGLAQAELETAMEIDPNSVAARVNFGILYFKQGEFDLAIAEYMKAVKIDPDNINTHLNLGAAYSKQHKTDLAIAEYELVLKLTRQEAGAHKKLGDNYTQKGQLDQAITEYQTAVKIDHNYAEAFQALGKAYEKREGEYEKSGQTSEALRTGLKAIGAFRKVGQLKVEAEEIKKHQMAVKKDPGSAAAHLRLGEAYLAEGSTIENEDGAQAAQLWYLKMFVEFEKVHKLGGEMPAALFRVLQSRFGR